MGEHLRQKDLVEFEVGYDRFTAQAILAECEADGRRVELLTMDNDGHSPGGLALQPHRLIGIAGDADAIHQVIRSWIPDDAVDQPAMSTARRNPLVVAVGLLLLLIVLGGLFLGALGLL
ncbi:MAG: hypothetical protein RIB98_00690 [Acidimicrobiales bacterium]